MDFTPSTEFDLRSMHAQAATCRPYPQWRDDTLKAYHRRNPALPAEQHQNIFLVWVRVFIVPGAFTDQVTLH